MIRIATFMTPILRKPTLNFLSHSAPTGQTDINTVIFIPCDDMADGQGKIAPSKLGEYTVIRDIAEGTFGKVKSMSGSSPM